jgi:peptidoglycan/LPS O-acetylase OafA/YrhL
LNLLICFTLLVLAGGSARALGPHLGASLIYLHSAWYGQPSAINPVAWTLEVEVQFYCLAPLLAMVYRIRSRVARRAILAGAVLLAGSVQTLCWGGPARARLSILFAIQFFLMGLWLADVYVVDWNQRPASHWRWDVVSLLCWPLIFVPGDLQVWIFLPFLILAVYIAAFQGVIFKRMFRNPAVTTLGGMCYTIYLFHYQLIPGVLRFSGPWRLGGGLDTYCALQLAIYAPILLLVSGVYFVFVERPCMARDWPRRAW